MLIFPRTVSPHIRNGLRHLGGGVMHARQHRVGVILKSVSFHCHRGDIPMSDGNTAAIMVEPLQHFSRSPPCHPETLFYTTASHASHLTPTAHLRSLPCRALMALMGGAATTTVVPEQHNRQFLSIQRYDRGILVRVLSDNKFSF